MIEELSEMTQMKQVKHRDRVRQEKKPVYSKSKSYSKTKEVFFVLGRCPRCGKQSYASRSDAKKAMRRVSRQNKSAYRCERDMNVWHFGSLPKSVKNGSNPRSILTTTPVEGYKS